MVHAAQGGVVDDALGAGDEWCEAGEAAHRGAGFAAGGGDPFDVEDDAAVDVGGAGGDEDELGCPRRSRRRLRRAAQRRVRRASGRISPVVRVELGVAGPGAEEGSDDLAVGVEHPRQVGMGPRPGTVRVEEAEFAGLAGGGRGAARSARRGPYVAPSTGSSTPSPAPGTARRARAVVTSTSTSARARWWNATNGSSPRPSQAAAPRGSAGRDAEWSAVLRNLEATRTRRGQVRSCCSWPVTSCQRCPSHRFAWPPSGPARLQWRTSSADGCRVSKVAKHPGFPHGPPQTWGHDNLSWSDGAQGRGGGLDSSEMSTGPELGVTPKRACTRRYRLPAPSLTRRRAMTLCK